MPIISLLNEQGRIVHRRIGRGDRRRGERRKGKKEEGEKGGRMKGAWLALMWHGSGSGSRSNLKPRKYKSLKILPHKNVLLCFVLALCALNKSVISMFKNTKLWWFLSILKQVFQDFGWFLAFGSASLIWIRIREAKIMRIRPGSGSTSL